MTSGDLSALAQKYRALAALRRARDEGGAPATRTTLRALSRDFPGCLRELDVLGLPELERRAEAAAAAARGAAREPWMRWITAFHATLGAALALRLRLGRTRARLDDGSALAHAAAVARPGALPFDAAFVRALASPPGGRLVPVILRRMACTFDVPATTIAATLFPSRRLNPYGLEPPD